MDVQKLLLLGQELNRSEFLMHSQGDVLLILEADEILHESEQVHRLIQDCQIAVQ